MLSIHRLQPNPFHPMRLLLVEDDPMIGETLLDVLRAEHYAVDWVKDGEVADMALRAGFEAVFGPTVTAGA